MLNRVCRTVLLVLLSSPGAIAQTAPGPGQLKIGGSVSTPLILTVADLKAMPRTTIRAMNTHEKKTETYEGVLLEELLRKAGAPHGEQLRGALRLPVPTAEGPLSTIRWNCCARPGHLMENSFVGRL